MSLSNKFFPDVLVIILIPIISTVVVEVFHFPFIVSIFLYFGLPVFYLFIRKPKIIKKTILFSLIPWWPLTIIWEYLAYVDKTWFVPASFRLFRESLPYQDIFWGILYLVYAISVYEFFLNKSSYKKGLFPTQFKYLALGLYGGLAIFILFYYLEPRYLYVPYFFLVMGVLFCVVPLLLFISKYPKLFSRLLVLVPYFFISFGLMEHASLTQGHFWYPGNHYLGVLNFFGHRLPVDEIVFFWVFSVPSLVCWYEYFADDQK